MITNKINLNICREIQLGICYPEAMIRRGQCSDTETICAIINEAAQAYKSVIPSDRWREPYISLEELRNEVRRGIEFRGCEENGRLAGVMGL